VSTAPDDAQIRNLIRSVEVAAAEGRDADSERLLSEARAAAPNHPLVLNEEGRRALNRGDARTARDLLERAVAGAPHHPGIWLNLATSFRGLGMPDEEARALERVLAIDPRQLLALLQKGSLLEQQGRPRAAAVAYQNALATIPPGAQINDVLRPGVQRAADAVRANNASLEAALSARLGDVRARIAAAGTERFDHCIDALLAKRAIYVAQPTFLPYPKLAAYEFYAREEFPWLAELEAATAAIRAEFEQALAANLPAAEAEAQDRPPPWRTLHLWRQGRRVEENIARCPRTADLLVRLPMCEVPDHSPVAFFSILDPKTHIPPATGMTNTRLTVHLPLVAAPGCRLRVGSETRAWSAGRAFVFDDTIQHEAVNESDAPLALLIFDVWNPQLSAAERELVRAAVAAYGEYYRSEPPAPPSATA